MLVQHPSGSVDTALRAIAYEVVSCCLGTTSLAVVPWPGDVLLSTDFILVMLSLWIVATCQYSISSGDYTFGGHQITRPETHFNEKYKPEGFDVRQIFVSPSIKYCTNGEVYAKSHL